MPHEPMVPHGEAMATLLDYCTYCNKRLHWTAWRHGKSHNLGSTHIECPESWKPWDRLDHLAIIRGEWFIRFMPLPMYAYVVKHRTKGFQIIQPFPPFVTAPTHPKVWDAVAARIVQDT